MKKYLNRIRLAREKSKYSQEEIAQKLAITTRSYRNIEQGITKLTFSRLLPLCEILSIRLEEVFIDYKNDAPEEVEVLEESTSKTHETSRNTLLVYEKIIASKEEEIQFLRGLVLRR
jgi:transcriptional regulator with XRE-family HTH domain